MRGTEFLPVSREEMRARDWYYYDFLVVMADAYIDHPSFGSTLIARLLEAEGYRVAVLAQPDWHDYTVFAEMGKPRFGVFIGGGNLDSMVAHYTVAKRRRDKDLYSPGGKMGYRPDPGYHCVCQPGPGGLRKRHTHYHRRAGGVAAALCPLRLLGR